MAFYSHNTLSDLHLRLRSDEETFIFNIFIILNIDYNILFIYVYNLIYI